MANISRRDFLKGMGAGAATLAASGLLNTFASAEGIPEGAPEATAEEETNWREAPEAIAADQITETIDADVVVIGMGHAGTACARVLAENGKNVVCLEAQAEDSYSVYGEDFGHINSEYLKAQGVDEVDPVEFFNNWMLNAQNMPNPTLVMKYSKYSGQAFDHFINRMSDEALQNISVDFWPRTENTISEIGGQKFWNGTVQFIIEGYEFTQVLKDQHAEILENGGTILYGTKACQLVKDGDRVTGVIAEKDGAYIQINGAEAVVLSAGDFAGNAQMREDLLLASVDLGDENPWVAMGRDGSGIRMGMWAGGRLEARPLPSMGGDTSHPRAPAASMQSLWLNDKGERFCNEFFGDTIWTGRQCAVQKFDTLFTVTDGKLMDQITYNMPAHDRFDWSDPEEVAALQNSLDGAYAAGAEGYSAGGMTDSYTLYAADDLETAISYTGVDDELKAKMLKSIERYNAMCAAGVDTDFGKDARVLFPIDTPPYYISRGDVGMMRFMLVSVGGLMTDGKQNVLSQAKDPIPGLYATGNCCGRRFGSAYFSPLAGVSVGMAETLGYVLGRELCGEEL